MGKQGPNEMAFRQYGVMGGETIRIPNELDDLDEWRAAQRSRLGYRAPPRDFVKELDWSTTTHGTTTRGRLAPTKDWRADQDARLAMKTPHGGFVSTDYQMELARHGHFSQSATPGLILRAGPPITSRVEGRGNGCIMALHNDPCASLDKWRASQRARLANEDTVHYDKREYKRLDWQIKQ